MKVALRTLTAVSIGLFVALALLAAVELFSAVVHPLPEDFGGTTEEMCRHVQRYPQWVLAVVVPAWAFTALISTWTAQNWEPYPLRDSRAAFAGGTRVQSLDAALSDFGSGRDLLMIPTAILAGIRPSIRHKIAMR